MAMHNFIDRARIRSRRGVRTAGGCSRSLHGRGIIERFPRETNYDSRRKDRAKELRARGRSERVWLGLAGDRRLKTRR